MALRLMVWFWIERLGEFSERARWTYGMQPLGAYDRLKSEAMTQHNQVANVGAAIKRGL